MAPFKGGGGRRRFACPLMLLSFWDEEGSEMTITARNAEVLVSNVVSKEAEAIQGMVQSNGAGVDSRQTRLWEDPVWTQGPQKDNRSPSVTAPQETQKCDEGLEAHGFQQSVHQSIPSSFQTKLYQDAPFKSPSQRRTSQQQLPKLPSTHRKTVTQPRPQLKHSQKSSAASTFSNESLESASSPDSAPSVLEAETKTPPSSSEQAFSSQGRMTKQSAVEPQLQSGPRHKQNGEITTRQSKMMSSANPGFGDEHGSLETLPEATSPIPHSEGQPEQPLPRLPKSATTRPRRRHMAPSLTDRTLTQKSKGASAKKTAFGSSSPRRRGR